MPAFDIVSKVDLQKLDNAINNARKELVNRYDFHGSKTSLELDKKDMSLRVITENEMKMKAVEDIIISRMVKQSLDPTSLDFGKEHYASGNMLRKDIKIKQGIDKETAKKIVRIIKDSGIKAQPSIMDEQVRVSGKKIDDLQKIISVVKEASLDLPLQYENFRN
jgi:cyclic-di-GMP-binding protein